MMRKIRKKEMKKEKQELQMRRTFKLMMHLKKMLPKRKLLKKMLLLNLLWLRMKTLKRVV